MSFENVTSSTDNVFISSSSIQFNNLQKRLLHSSVILSAPEIPSMQFGKGTLQLFMRPTSFQKRSVLPACHFAANKLPISWFVCRFKNRSPYLKLARERFISSKTKPCFGLSASTHALKLCLAASYN